jgi:hypothetical protein
MTRALLLLIIGILPVHVYAQVAAPESVPEGQAIQFSLLDDEEGLEARWLLLNPFDDVVINEIRPKGSNDLILDPPCGWTGKIRVQVIVLDAEQRVKDIRVSIVQVGSPDKPVDPPNPPPEPPKPPEPEPKPEYDGENEYGMGSVSYENCPKDSPYSASVADLMSAAAGHLKGYDGLKVVSAVGLRAGTDYEIYVWLDNQMKNHSPEWRKWYESCQKYREKMGIGVGSPLNMHWQLLKEMEAGVRAANG